LHLNKICWAISIVFLLCGSVIAKSVSLKILYKNQVIIVDSHFKKQKQAPEWKVLKRIDPNSSKLMTYEGYDLAEFFSYLKNKLNLKEIHHVETMALDGYRLTIDRGSINSKGAFLALKVNGVSPKGIYNKILKSYFRWEPSYILLDPSSSEVSVASPYQVKSIKIFDKKTSNPILLNLDEDLVKGGEVFIKTCSKCHRVKGYGGKKAPAMKFMVRRWKGKSDEDLGTFLRNPQGVLKRKIQMSGYSGPESDLKELIKFLRSL